MTWHLGTWGWIALLAMGCMAQERPAAEATAARHPVLACTMDFLDFVFYDMEGSPDVYELPVLEKRIRTLAAMGFKKLNLRVNCLGLTLYPTTVSVMYGEGGRGHWDHPAQSKRIAKTVRTYDMCREVIRLGHQYGMEVWAWESLADGGGTYGMFPALEKYGELGRRLHYAPFLDPFYSARPDYFCMRDPRRHPSSEKIAQINAEIRRHPVGRIVCRGTEKRMPLRITKDNLAIYTSEDNLHYTLYDQPFDFTSGLTPEGYNMFTVSGLNLDSMFVKLSHVRPFDKGPDFSFAFRPDKSHMEVFDTDGNAKAVAWRVNASNVDGPNGSLCLHALFDVALDHDRYEIGFVTGVLDRLVDRYFVGVPEFCIPAVMEHQVARFRELAAYPFDGFMMNYRTHSVILNPEEYGFNPEVRDLYRQRHGVDIWTEPFDEDKLLTLRADAIGDYLLQCKKIAGGRPLYITGLKPAPPGQRSVQNAFRGMGVDMFSRLPWQYERYFREGSVDGVMMTGGYFPEFFTTAVTGGRPVKIGIFRERPKDKGGYPKNYDFAADMERLYNDPNLDEIELYEALHYIVDPAIHYSDDPERMQVLFRLTGHQVEK